jgi:hypothetical protein
MYIILHCVLTNGQRHYTIYKNNKLILITKNYAEAKYYQELNKKINNIL